MRITQDIGNHIGNLNALLKFGNTCSIYPTNYIEIVSSVLLAGIDLIKLINLNSLLLVTIFLLGIFLLSKMVRVNNKERS